MILNVRLTLQVRFNSHQQSLKKGSILIQNLINSLLEHIMTNLSLNHKIQSQNISVLNNTWRSIQLYKAYKRMKKHHCVHIIDKINN
jgi:hypothetical protein